MGNIADPFTWSILLLFLLFEHFLLHHMLLYFQFYIIMQASLHTSQSAFCTNFVDAGAAASSPLITALTGRRINGFLSAPCVRSQTRRSTHSHTHTHTHTHSHTHIHMHMHKYIRTHTHTHPHTRKHTHLHTHSHTYAGHLRETSWYLRRGVCI
jgi:hypothetical protein